MKSVGHSEQDHRKKLQWPECQLINTDPAYSTPQPITIPAGTRIPALEVHTVEKILTQQKRTTPGPDGLPYWI